MTQTNTQDNVMSYEELLGGSLKLREMTLIIALDATTGAWDQVRIVKKDLAGPLAELYTEVSIKMRSPWVFLTAAANTSVFEIEALINDCMKAYVDCGGLAAAEQ